MKILRTPEEWERGLQGEPVGETALFVMIQAAPWPISMDGMNYPLDVYWLSEGGMVVERATLFPGQPVYWPQEAAKYVLEMPMRHDPIYNIGDFVEVPP